MSLLPTPDPPAANQCQPPADCPASNTSPWFIGRWSSLRASLAAGLFVWILMQAFHPYFWTEKGRDEYGFLPVPVQRTYDRDNTMLILAVVGGLTSAVLVVTESLRKRTLAVSTAFGALSGTIGVVLGGLGGFLGHVVFESLKSNNDMSDLMKLMLAYGAMFSTVGGGVGISFGLILGRDTAQRASCSIRGILAGVLAAIAYPMIVAMVLPQALTSVLIPDEPLDRLLWLCIATVLMGLVIPSFHGHKNRTAPSRETNPVNQ